MDYSRQDLYMDLLKKSPNIHYINTHKTNLLLKEMKLYSIDNNDKIPGDYKYPLSTIPAAQNQKQTRSEVSAKLLKLKID